MPDKPVTVRLPQELLRQLMGLSIVDGTTLADELRSAATEYVKQRREAPDFQAKVAEAQARQQDVLSALTGN